MWWPLDQLGTLFRTQGAEGGIPYWFQIDIGVNKLATPWRRPQDSAHFRSNSSM
jgi:hypothetical protein